MEREALKLLEDATRSCNNIDEQRALDALIREAQPVQEPVAWFRYENGMRIYYETKAWDDLQALYTTPPLPVQEPRPMWTDKEAFDLIAAHAIGGAKP